VDLAIRSDNQDFVETTLRRSNDFDLGRRFGLSIGSLGISKGSPLTPREDQVLDLVADGRTNDEVAGLLFISPVTVKAHLRHIYEKLGARNRVEAVRLRNASATDPP
jgi:DNA-binding CsgD family transcriptional regulator